jgi:hypothetical protein
MDNRNCTTGQSEFTVLAVADYRDSASRQPASECQWSSDKVNDMSLPLDRPILLLIIRLELSQIMIVAYDGVAKSRTVPSGLFGVLCGDSALDDATYDVCICVAIEIRDAAYDDGKTQQKLMTAACGP